MTVTCRRGLLTTMDGQDIYIACDSTPSFLLRNNGDGTFADIGLESGVALNEDGMEQAGMGVGIGDFNLDGKLDIFKTHFADDTNILYQNSGKGSFDDVTIRANLGVESDTPVGARASSIWITTDFLTCFWLPAACTRRCRESFPPIRSTLRAWSSEIWATVVSKS